MYRDRFPGLDAETMVALCYEEFCRREEDGQAPFPTEYDERFPDLSERLRRVFDIHELVGNAASTDLHVARPRPDPLPRGPADHRRFPPGRGAGPGLVRPGLPGPGAAARRSTGRAEGGPDRLPRAPDPGPAPAHPHRPGSLVPDRPGHGPAPALHALFRPGDAEPAPGRSRREGGPDGRRNCSKPSIASIHRRRRPTDRRAPRPDRPWPDSPSPGPSPGGVPGWPMPWPMRTTGGSCTATSSRRTCW